MKVGETAYGTPVYLMQIKDKDLLTGMGRARNPPVKGRLHNHVQERYGAPAVVLLKFKNKFTRIFKLTEEGLLIPTSISNLPSACRNKLIELGAISKEWKHKGQKGW